MRFLTGKNEIVFKITVDEVNKKIIVDVEDEDEDDS